MIVQFLKIRMFIYFKKYWAVLIVLGLSFWAVKALLVPGFFSMHDDQQIARLFELDISLKAGQIPPRWVENLGFGYGYPFFNFYPPLVYYLGEIFHTMGFSFINSTKLVILSGFVFSAFFMYLWVKNHFGKIPAIFSALLYTYAPYHAVNVYVRGDIPEFFSFVWIPAVFWSTDLLFKTKKISYALLLAIFLAFVVLTHSLVALVFPVFFLIYVLFHLLSNRKDLKKLILLLFLSGFVAISLSMYFWLPVFLEKKFTLVDEILTRELASYKLHFVYIRQFWNSIWGYGGSLYGIEDGLSFSVGKIQLIVSFISALFIAYKILKKKILEFNFPIVIFVLFLLSLYMATFYSEWIWNLITPFSYLQFPWRFLLFTAVFSSFLGGFFIYFIEKNFGKLVAVTAFLILGSIVFFSIAQNFQPAKFLNVDDSFYTNPEDIKWRVSKMSFEFVPKGVATKISDINTTQLDIDENDIPGQPYKVLKGEMDVKVISNKPHSKEFQVFSKSFSVFQVNTFSFPGWEASIDGKKVKYNDNNKLKLIVLDVTPGSHSINVNFVNTLPRAVGNAVSLVTIFNLIGFGLFSIKKLWKK